MNKGFIFTIDSMVSLLFAFFIISMPVGETGSSYTSSLALVNIALIHQQSHHSPLMLLERVGMCGEYVLYDAKMQTTYTKSSCTCNTSPYYYPYIEKDGRPYLVSLKACREVEVGK